MAILFALLLIVVLIVSLGLTVLGMPGNWLMVAATSIYAYFVPASSSVAIGWKMVVFLFVLAVVGEIIELLTAVAGTSKAGGSKRGAALALFGSLAGGLFGMFVGLPVPLVGSLFAALLFAALGAMAGAIMGETWSGQNLHASWRIGKAAFVARLLGTLGKVLMGAAMAAVVVVDLLVGWISSFF